MVGPWLNNFTFRAHSKPYGQMWLRCKCLPSLCPTETPGPHGGWVPDQHYGAGKSYCPRFIPSHQVYSENGPRLAATDPIAASVMAAAFRAESGFSRRPLDPSAA
jgi:hypothetical protein